VDRLILFIATGAYSGYLPKAPGTWGSLVGVGLWAILTGLPLGLYLLLVCTVFVIGTFCAGSTEKIVDRPDPSIVVIDEVAGQLLALTAAPLHPLAALTGFLLFRFFDILKPFPVGWFDRHVHGGLGIMLDDIFAGLYAFLILQAGLHFLVL
jgi:phosphatidylglycerophosphatase A